MSLDRAHFPIRALSPMALFGRASRSIISKRLGKFKSMSDTLKQSTAVTIPVSLYTVDGNTPVTGITSAGIVLRAIKADGISVAVTPTSLTEVDSVNMPGLYTLGLPASATSQLGSLVLFIKNTSLIHGTVTDTTTLKFIVSLIDDANKIHLGRWKVDTTANTLTMYDTDGLTAIKTFNLKDDSGSPTSTKIFERT